MCTHFLALNKEPFFGHTVKQSVFHRGTRWRSWLRHCTTSRKVTCSRWCHWNFPLIQSFGLHYGPGVVSASNRQEYQECFVWGKGGRCVGPTSLPPSCADCREIWRTSTSWNPLGLSRPVMGLLYIYLLPFSSTVVEQLVFPSFSREDLFLFPVWLQYSANFVAIFFHILSACFFSVIC